ncbi:hypothetical protein PVAR5_1434 [Paecilomyces variotii No. 5]|uniref:Uncharacterized protein n=1 Tax=Byssochlamys spectabilis (strain No. 5 / NBRC 109023) TaxID=1356009 RepID=V5FLU9_BYSSN|nr:hypothetical protein PVAR5_1434 [Paecilomyces variotii No. 5]
MWALLMERALLAWHKNSPDSVFLSFEGPKSSQPSLQKFYAAAIAPLVLDEALTFPWNGHRADSLVQGSRATSRLHPDNLREQGCGRERQPSFYRPREKKRMASLALEAAFPFRHPGSAFGAIISHRPSRWSVDGRRNRGSPCQALMFRISRFAPAEPAPGPSWTASTADKMIGRNLCSRLDCGQPSFLPEISRSQASLSGCDAIPLLARLRTPSQDARPCLV